MAGATKKKKIRSTLACTSSFLTFLTIIHSRGQRYVVPLQNTQKNINYQKRFVLQTFYSFCFECLQLSLKNSTAVRSTKKIRSTLACTSSFLTFFAIIHSRGQRYVVPLTTYNTYINTKMIFHTSFFI